MAATQLTHTHTCSLSHAQHTHTHTPHRYIPHILSCTHTYNSIHTHSHSLHTHMFTDTFTSIHVGILTNTCVLTHTFCTSHLHTCTHLPSQFSDTAGGDHREESLALTAWKDTGGGGPGTGDMTHSYGDTLCLGIWGECHLSPPLLQD